VGLVGCQNNWHYRCSRRKLILHIPPPISCVYLAVDSATFGVCRAHRFKIEVRLKWKMWQQELCLFENLPVV
jgi:hypothetical protein